MNALVYVLIVTMQLGGILDGHIETVRLPGRLSEFQCSPASGYAAAIVAANPRIGEMRKEGWRVARWDCQRVP